MNKLLFQCRLVSFLILLSFFIYGWKIMYIATQIAAQWWHDSIWWGVYFVITIPLFLILNLAAAFGLFFMKKFGFWFAYFAILFSTVFFGYPYIPYLAKYINRLFSIEPRYMTVMVINLLLLCYVGYLHVKSRSTNR